MKNLNCFQDKTKRSVYLHAIFMSLPAFIAILIFNYIPILQAIRYSFYDYNIISGRMRWVGLANYTDALKDPFVLNSFWVTVKYFLMNVPLLLLFGLILSLAVEKPRFGTGFLRSIILLPVVTSLVVATTIWGFMYHPSNGLFNSILQTLKLPPQGFLTTEKLALPSLVVLGVWKDVGLVMLFFLSGLTAIPYELHEVAMLDGASYFKRLIHITLPMLRGTIIFILIFTSIGAFRVFTPVYMTTKGGPLRSTQVIVMSIYDNAFRYNQMGFASAISILVALILIGLSVIQFLSVRERKSKN